MVSELELVSLAAEGEPHDLMAEADTEDRFLADQLLHVLLRVWHCVGIARTVGEEDAVRIHRQHVVRRRRSRNDSDPAACLG